MILYDMISLILMHSITATITPSDYVIHPGESFTINCTIKPSALGSVDPTLLYFKYRPLDGDNLIRVATEAHLLVENDTMQINVTNVQLSDAGSYRCYHPGGYRDNNLANVSPSRVQIGGNGMYFYEFMNGRDQSRYASNQWGTTSLIGWAHT